VKATFFVVGNENEQAKGLYQRIVEEGHTIGMHSYSHKYSVIYESLAAFQDDLRQLRNYIHEITGVETNIMRFPGGSSNQVSNTDTDEFIRFLKKEGINYYDWNVISGDASSQTFLPAELVSNVVRDVKQFDTSIVLMHDASTKSATVEALPTMIDQLTAMNMELLPINSDTKLIQHIPVDSIPD
jgi:peptidoglycan/xylan/chitin deacetylase (PgdA/CDA1 family)